MSEFISLDARGFGARRRLIVQNVSTATIGGLRCSASADGSDCSHFLSEIPERLAPGDRVELVLSEAPGPDPIFVQVTWVGLDGRDTRVVKVVRRF